MNKLLNILWQSTVEMINNFSQTREKYRTNLTYEEQQSTEDDLGDRKWRMEDSN